MMNFNSHKTKRIISSIIIIFLIVSMLAGTVIAAIMS